MSRENGMTRKEAGTAYVSSGTLTSSPTWLERIRPNAKLASDPISTVRIIVHQANEKAVAELMPEVLDEPISLGQDGVEAMERRVRRPDDPLEFDVALVAIERDQQHVVHGCQRPDQQQGAQGEGSQLDQHPPPAHSCISRVPSARIRMSVIGTSTGRADITAATPSEGWAPSKA